MFPRRLRAASIALAATLSLVASLSGCAAAPAVAPVSPLSDTERGSIRTAILNASWSDVAAQYPEAIRPPVRVQPTVADFDRSEAIVACLHSSGIIAAVSDGTVLYGNSTGQTQLEVAVAFYSCEASHPSQSQIAAYLNNSQSMALYNYYLSVVRPCLLTAGAPSPASPDRSAVAGLAGLAGWNPYQVIWTSGMPRTTIAYLERRCPPTPEWLDLGSHK
jgi:hypothetical protein